MTGTVEHWNEDRAVGTIIDEDEKKHFVLRRYVAPDELGRYFLIAGEAVEFQLGLDDIGRPCAVKVRPLWREAVDVNGYPGEYVIVGDDARFATRPIGGDVFLGENFFRTGNVLLVHKICKPRKGRSWFAADPQFVAETQDEFEVTQCFIEMKCDSESPKQLST